MRQNKEAERLTTQDWEVLSKNPIFAKIDSETLMNAIGGFGGSVRAFSARESILSPDSKGKSVVVILSGRAAVSTPDPSRQVLLRYLSPGEAVGVSNLFCDERFVSDIRAVSACRCLFLPEDAIRYLLDVSAVFREQYIRFLSGRIRFLNRKIGTLTAGSAERRLALYLSSLGSGTVRLEESISSLSTLLDVGRASLYRAFDRLTEDGWIIKDGKKLTIPDPAALSVAYRNLKNET